MKVLRIVLLVIAIIIVIPLLIAIFVKSDYRIERSVVINKPVEDVFEYVSHVKNQKYYNVWVQADPNLKQEFEGVDGTIGFINKWNGNDKAGQGEQEIVNLIHNEQVDLRIKFIRPFESTMNGSTFTKSMPSGNTKVTSAVYGVSKYPMNFMNLFMDGMLGKDMDTNLNNLKTVLEKQ
jgi:hypothetical protein